MVLGCSDRCLLVVVHDVAPVYVRELAVIVRELSRLLDHRFSAAIVPRWHGTNHGVFRGDYRGLLPCFGEKLLHGWTHQRRPRGGIISLATGRADELRGLDKVSIQSRIEAAQRDFIELTGKPAQGFVPPAWQLPILSCQLDSVGFVMRFRKLESCTNAKRTRQLVTWSWDWGRIGWLSPGGDILARILTHYDSSAVPCIAVHPADLRSGWFVRAVRLIEQLLHQGRQPVFAADLIIPSEANA